LSILLLFPDDPRALFSAQRYFRLDAYRFKTLAGNSQWRIVFVFNILLLTAVVTRGSATLYYVNYVLLRPELVLPLLFPVWWPP
jgi:Na+/melibiose symporter-like transporter